MQCDDRTESVSRKIREAELSKVPYMLIVGDREQEAQQVSVREHRRGDLGRLGIEELAEQLRAQVKTRAKA